MNCHFNVKTIEERNNFIGLAQNLIVWIRIFRILDLTEFYFLSNIPTLFWKFFNYGNSDLDILFKRMCQLKYRKQVVRFMQQEKLSPV